MRDKNKAIIQNNLYWLYLTGFFLILALPLLSLPPWFSPPDWGKTIVFRTVLSLLIFILLYQILLKRYHFPEASYSGILCRRHPLFLPFWLLGALLAIFLLATIFSQNILFSLWGSPYRSGGFVNFAFYTIFAILAFFSIKNQHWQKIWDFSFGIGILVALVAVVQQFGLLKEIFISIESRPPSTIGGPTFLAAYLLLLSFLTISLGIEEKLLTKKLLYFLFLLLFIYVAIFITQTRSFSLGFAIGFLWLLFGYPKKIIHIKIVGGLLLILIVLGLYFLKNHSEFYLNKPPIIRHSISRILSLSQGIKTDERRVSAWKVSLSALKDRPLLGYGPENFSIGFDRYYDPSLAGIEKTPEAPNSWWDKAHNFVFDIAVTAGVPALIIYLSLFGTLFWKLQKLKYQTLKNKEEMAQNAIIAHGIQATFIAYFTANFFSFDAFSSYLISFLLIGYSLHLIYFSDQNHQKAENGKNKFREKSVFRLYKKIIKYRKTIIICLAVSLVWFLWNYNIKPFQINTQYNIAKYFVENNQCDKAFARLDKTIERRSFLDAYIRLRYTDLIKKCEPSNPEKSLEYASKGVQMLKENIKIQPHYTRNWLVLGAFMTVLIDKEKNPEKKAVLAKEADSYFEKAQQLSPKRQEVFIEWAKAKLVGGKYFEAKEKSQHCIDVNPKLADCYWFFGLSEIFLGNIEIGKENIKISQEKGYTAQSFSSLSQLAQAYTYSRNFKELAETYEQLIALKPSEYLYYGTLACVWRELGQIDKARETALRVIELNPEAKEEAELFIKTMPHCDF